jgi:hypothetical protein
MTQQQAEEHQRKHGFDLRPYTKKELETGKVDFTRKVIPRRMNNTEREFSWMLEAQRRQSQILRWEYEGITLQWGGLRYTPDFVVFTADERGLYLPLKFIETKGAYIRDDALVKFKAARAHYPEFQFEMWRKAEGRWAKIYG